MMKLAKYKNFLLDKALYLQNVKFWKDTIINLSENNFEEWTITKFANGEDFLDGNPIFSAFYPSLSKAIRIIQIPNDETVSSLRVWLDSANYADKLLKELVLVLQPTDRGYNSAISLLTLFLNGQSVGKAINAYNIFYKKEVDLKRIGLDLNKAKSKLIIKPFNDLNYINVKNLQDKNLDINDLKKIYQEIFSQKRSIEKTLERNEFEKLNKDVLKEIDTLIDVLSIGHLINFNNELNKDLYINLVQKKYGISNYVSKLHKTSSHIDVLNKESINGLIA